jgi:GTP-binding protein
VSAPPADADPGPDLAEEARVLFAREAAFYFAAAEADKLPPMDRPEIALAGRSNVGKSSLLNALTNRKALARTSHTPGRTQQLNFFNVDDRLTIVDMPGYGYAKVEKAKVDAWTKTIHAYLRGRANLARVFVLIDARHGLKDTDAPVLDTLDKAAVSYQLVLTKVDELKPSAVEGVRAATLEAVRKRPAAFPAVLASSSRTGAGMDELRLAIATLLDERASLR